MRQRPVVAPHPIQYVTDFEIRFSTSRRESGAGRPRYSTDFGNAGWPSATGRPAGQQTGRVRSGRDVRDKLAYIRGCALRSKHEFVRRSRSVSPMVRRVLRLLNRARLAFCDRVTSSYVRSSAVTDSGPRCSRRRRYYLVWMVSCYGISGVITSFRSAPARFPTLFIKCPRNSEAGGRLRLRHCESGCPVCVYAQCLLGRSPSARNFGLSRRGSVLRILRNRSAPGTLKAPRQRVRGRQALRFKIAKSRPTKRTTRWREGGKDATNVLLRPFARNKLKITTNSLRSGREQKRYRRPARFRLTTRKRCRPGALVKCLEHSPQSRRFNLAKSKRVRELRCFLLERNKFLRFSWVALYSLRRCFRLRTPQRTTL